MIEMAKQQRRNRVLFYIALFMPLLGVNILAYAYLLIFLVLNMVNARKKTRRGILIGMAVAFFFLVKYLQTGSLENTRIIMQYYFGVVLFCFYLDRTDTVLLDIDKLIKVLCYEIIIEAVLVNTILPASVLPNYTEAYIQHSSYQRPMSIGCNTTVTATILCMLLAYREMLRKKSVLFVDEKLDILGGLTIIVLASGMGIGLWCLYFAYRMKGSFTAKNIKLVMVFVLLLFSLSFVPLVREALFKHLLGDDGDSAGLTEFKAEETERYFTALTGFSNWIGLDFKSMPLLTQGDIAYIEMYLSIGVVGVLLFILIVTNYFNKYNWLPVLLGLIGIYHYGGIFSMPGQLVFAYCLLFNAKKSKYWYNIK